jgi:hypothetical protein
MIRSKSLASRRSTDGAAALIDDPILRLRFLRTLATVECSASRRRLFLRMLALLALLVVVACWFLVPRAAARATFSAASSPRIQRVSATSGLPLPAVWLVEQNHDADIYSNGLRIDNRYSVSTRARSYFAFPRDHPDGQGTQRTDPAGIVFHTTESMQAPFEAEQNRVLTRIGESLLLYVRRRRAYNFVVDRFGRVYRVVPEGDIADHAGYSVWSDDEWIYVNLNESFLGVSLEARTSPAQGEPEISPAQVRAAAMLIEMLRGRYRIAAGNCVTHGQVSVNPSNMLVGHHTDWASAFPFGQLGLPDNYSRPLPAVMLFGFASDPDFRQRAGERVHQGVELAQAELRMRAGALGLTPEHYRAALQKQFRKRLEQMHHEHAAPSNGVE